jgi:PhzF family phenazine biosynthesis protein
MTDLPIYRIDAFADRPFAGNPACVVPLEAPLPDATMQAIAAENNAPATAFFHPAGDAHAIRWFSPATELPLCGHGTLASGFVLLTLREKTRDKAVFVTKSGARLEVTRDGDGLAMTLPAQAPAPCPTPDGLAAALGAAPRETLAASYYLAVFDSADEVIAVDPDFAALRRLGRGTIVTAPGRDGVDCVSRMLVPAAGIDEDAATGSAHAILTPYWTARLGKKRLVARQASRRGATLHCCLAGDRVMLSGRAVLTLEGRITV